MGNLRFLILFLFFIGMSAIVIGYVRSFDSCPPPKVIYKFIPRTFREAQEDPVKPSVIFSQMFNAPTPYVGGFSLGNMGPTKNNLGFISQG